MSPRAILVGLPGAGKTTVGEQLAKRLGLAFADSDALVEGRTGRTVPEIFAAEGEAAFRTVEAATVSAALRDYDGVLALGGGAVTTAATRKALAASGIPVVLLRAEQPTLLARLGSAADRPLLVSGPAERLAELAADREPLYREVATLVVDTDGHSCAEVVDAVLDRLAAVT